MSTSRKDFTATQAREAYEKRKKYLTSEENVLKIVEEIRVTIYNVCSRQQSLIYEVNINQKDTKVLNPLVDMVISSLKDYGYKAERPTMCYSDKQVSIGTNIHIRW